MNSEWYELNQAYLASAIGEVKQALSAHSESLGRAPVSAPAKAAKGGQTLAQMGDDFVPSLAVIENAFQLSPFERLVLLLCAGIELDGEVGRLAAACGCDASSGGATFSLALAALPGAHWSALASGGALRRWRLVDVSPKSGLTTGALRIDERILAFLLGLEDADPRLAGLIEPIAPPPALLGAHQDAADQIAALWRAPQPQGRRPVVQICGPDSDSLAAIGAQACRSLRLNLVAVRPERLPADSGEWETLATLLDRESVLRTAAIMLEWDDWTAGESSRGPALTYLASRIQAPLMIAAHERKPLRRRTTVAFDAPRPTVADKRALWEASLGPIAGALGEAIDLIADQFDVSAAVISDVIAEATGPAKGADADKLPDLLWDSCRRRSRPRLEDLAQRIETNAGWDELILPDPQRRVLGDIAVHARRRGVVYEKWGFAKRGSRGLGISALFAGSSGTGKTLAAEVLANDLRLDLYRIDLSAVVSKYIGETEKNLRQIFDAAEAGGAILLFDEADALFGKRTEVKDSHDRFANIEVSYLLQRMECYRGLAVLTTNIKSALDNAFLRRLRFVVQFPFPDSAQRAEIWRHVFPALTPTDGLDPLRLAQLNIAGGNIRNIALGAAFIAAQAGQPVTMAHIAHAAEAEYGKLEKALTATELAGW